MGKLYLYLYCRRCLTVGLNKQTSQSLTARCAIPRLVRLIAAVVNLIAVELRRPQAVAGVVAFELIIAARQRRCSVIVIIIK